MAYKDPKPNVVLSHDHLTAEELDRAITAELRLSPVEHKTVWGKINTCKECWGSLQARLGDPQAGWRTAPHPDLSKVDKTTTDVEFE
jgi:hypothetical protein